MDNNNIWSFGLSSPGTLYSSKKFGYKVSNLDLSSVSMIPRRDLIPMVDDHGGNVQMISCTEKGALDCHGSVNSMCELYSKCSQDLFRNITFMDCLCNEKYDWDLCH